MSITERVAASYRDPSGYVVSEKGIYKRVVTHHGLKNYERYLASGLHARLVKAGLILDFEEEATPRKEESWLRILVPEQIDFVSYPYEWAFDEFRDAALLTLEIQREALAHGLTLKDASPYNVQFRGSIPVFIDSLSFEENDGGPWIAYEQFCREFLGTLALMSYCSADAARHLRVELGGFPLSYASSALPLSSYLRSGLLLHLHLHARAAKSDRHGYRRGGAVSQINLIDSLRSVIEALSRPRSSTAWRDYYSDSRFYSSAALHSKRVGVSRLASDLRPRTVFDLGTNTGLFAKEFAAGGASVFAIDSDPHCVNQLYLDQRRASSFTRLLPLLIDVANPSPALGFGLKHTRSFFDRMQADLVLCLGLIHHLRFRENLPLNQIAETLARLGRRLLIEFVPGGDASAELLRNGRPGFEDYDKTSFLDEFGRYYRLLWQRPICNSDRLLCLFERRT
jgi:SAM-dependent methyltransferase